MAFRPMAMAASRLCLKGQRRWNRRLWRRLARAHEAVAGRSVGRPVSGSAALPRAAGRALRRHRSRAGALPRGRFDHAALLLVASAHRRTLIIGKERQAVRAWDTWGCRLGHIGLQADVEEERQAVGACDHMD
eukprot:scaffold51110_cov54-Phaeocystis_antarctica.AAC.1